MKTNMLDGCPNCRGEWKYGTVPSAPGEAYYDSCMRPLNKPPMRTCVICGRIEVQEEAIVAGVWNVKTEKEIRDYNIFKGVK